MLLLGSLQRENANRKIPWGLSRRSVDAVGSTPAEAPGSVQEAASQSNSWGRARGNLVTVLELMEEPDLRGTG